MDAVTDHELIERLLAAPLADLLAEARGRRDARGPGRTTYSRKVFIPLTRLCADVCHYCTFATTPSQLATPYLSPEEVLQIAHAGQAAGCKEALFTLGDAPERRYGAARDWLAERGFARTIDYVRHCAELVLGETGLLPHINAGLMDQADFVSLKPVAPSAGLMLETMSDRLCEKGGAHHGSPDKVPALRFASLEAAGRAGMPVTSGILVGIGETARERVEALIALRDLHRRHGHLQEVIVQNFCPKPGTKMAQAAEAGEDEFLRALAAARIVLDDAVSVQAPPNLNGERLVELLDAGIDDWGGISPVTQDHVNPEAPWPEIALLEEVCAAYGRPLVERLTAYPRFVTTGAWIDPALRPAVLRLSDAEGLARDSRWSPGLADPAPGTPAAPLGRRGQQHGVRGVALGRHRHLHLRLREVAGDAGGVVGEEALGAQLEHPAHERAHLGLVGRQRLGGHDRPAVLLARHRHRALRALDLDAPGCRTIELDERLVAEHGHVPGQVVPEVLGQEQHARLARPHGVDALARLVAPHEQRPAGAVLVLAGVDRHAQRALEPEALERGRRLCRELLHLRVAQLVEEAVDELAVGGQRHGARDAPAPLRGLHGDGGVSRDDVDAADRAALEAQHGAVAEVRHRPRRVPQHALADQEHRRLARLARVDPDPGGVPAPQLELPPRAVLHGDGDDRGRLVEPELGDGLALQGWGGRQEVGRKRGPARKAEDHSTGQDDSVQTRHGSCPSSVHSKHTRRVVRP